MSLDSSIKLYFLIICYVIYRECPEECREAVSSLMFAAARFADLPELRDLRSLFAERYGSSVEPYVNKEVLIFHLFRTE